MRAIWLKDVVKVSKTADLFENWKNEDGGVFDISPQAHIARDQQDTNRAFSEKWTAYSNEEIAEQEKLFEFQKKWFLKLYGYGTEKQLQEFLTECNVILDAGCGLGYKAAWLAELAPHATVVAIDFSEAVCVAQRRYGERFPNIVFARGDIADTKLGDGCIDLTICDQVIMHTEEPKKTLIELSRITSGTGSVLCYWYRKKALPRELIDDYFRSNAANLSHEELWDLSKGVLQLGKSLSELDATIDVPDIAALGIKGGQYDLQRFIYWNFLKCFWNEELGYATSLSTNFDWYSPVNAKRFSKEEVQSDLSAAGLSGVFFHEEDACYSGRFVK